MSAWSHLRQAYKDLAVSQLYIGNTIGTRDTADRKRDGMTDPKMMVNLHSGLYHAECVVSELRKCIVDCEQGNFG